MNAQELKNIIADNLAEIQELINDIIYHLNKPEKTITTYEIVEINNKGIITLLNNVEQYINKLNKLNELKELKG